jgi:hypothetical protein
LEVCGAPINTYLGIAGNSPTLRHPRTLRKSEDNQCNRVFMMDVSKIVFRTFKFPKQVLENERLYNKLHKENHKDLFYWGALITNSLFCNHFYENAPKYPLFYTGMNGIPIVPSLPARES